MSEAADTDAAGKFLLSTERPGFAPSCELGGTGGAIEFFPMPDRQDKSPERENAQPSIPPLPRPGMRGRAATAWGQLCGRLIADGWNPDKVLIELEMASDALALYRRLQAARQKDEDQIGRVQGRIRMLMAQIERRVRGKAPVETETEERPANKYDSL